MLTLRDGRRRRDAARSSRCWRMGGGATDIGEETATRRGGGLPDVGGREQRPGVEVEH